MRATRFTTEDVGNLVRDAEGAYDAIPEQYESLRVIEAMLGGLLMMRMGADSAEGWAHEGLEGKLAKHFDAIEKILLDSKKIYSGNIRMVEKVIA